MDSITIKFITNIAKPWDELNHLLCQRIAFQPEISDITRLAGSLAVAIKHQAEEANIERGVVDIESLENRLMSDVADSWKHGILKNPKRNNSFSVNAQFECDDKNNFRYVRNIVTVNHQSESAFDFMVVSMKAIQYWILKLQMTLCWQPAISEGSVDFHETAFLFFNSKYQVSMSSTGIQIVKRNELNQLIPYDGPSVKLAIYEQK